jgi:predicted Zn-dependent protease
MQNESRMPRPARIIVLAALLAAAPAIGQDSRGDLPDIGSPASTTITLADEYKIGRMILKGLRDAGQIVEDPEVTEYIQSVGSRLASHAHEGGHRFTFFVVKEPGINAFALPGGFIGVNAGLLTATANESELAGVLAHEIAHVTQRHIARSVQNAGRTNMASAAAVLAAILIGATTGMPADAMMGTITAAQGLAAQQQINFTRTNEAEADRVGMTFLANAGFDPNGMPAFFWTLQQRLGSSGTMIPDLLRTHPVTTERIAETRDRAEQLGRKTVDDSLSYGLIRERLRVQLLPPETNFADLYRDAASADLPSGDERRYGRAMALLTTGDAGTAREAAGLLKDLAERRPDVTLYQTGLGQAQLLAGDIDGSRRTLERALELSPRNVPVTVRYAETLLRDGQAKLAHQVLLDLFNNVPPTPEQARYIALVASAAGDTGDAYYYMSEYHVMGGELQMAIDQLRLALAVPDLNDVQRQRFEARIDELKEYLPKGRRAREVAAPTTPGEPGEGRGQGLTARHGATAGLQRGDAPVVSRP